MRSAVLFAGVIWASCCVFAQTMVVLSNACGRAEVDLLGAKVVSYVPTGGRDVLFCAGNGSYPAGQWQNRGIPLSWPWFDKMCAADLPMHGFARSSDWRVVSRCDAERESRLVLGLESSETTRRLWPHDFSLRYEIILGDELSVSLTTRNVAGKPFQLTAGFHPYFSVSKLAEARVDGLGPGLALPVPSVHLFLDVPTCRRRFPIRSGTVRSSCLPVAIRRRSSGTSAGRDGTWPTSSETIRTATSASSRRPSRRP